MPTITETGKLWQKLAWFAGLWAAGVITIACVAGLLHWGMARLE